MYENNIRKSYYIRPTSISFQPMKPISNVAWFLFFGTIVTLILVGLVNESLFIRLLDFTADNVKADPIAVLLYSLGSMVGTFDETFFKFGRAGNIVVLLWAFLSYFFILVYNSNLRAFIIGKINIMLKN